MRELTLAGNVCFVLRKIQELTDIAPSGSNILYPIENWNPHSIKTADEKKCIETLDAMYHVIKIKGSPMQEGKNLMFSLIKTRLFDNFYSTNCEVEYPQKAHTAVISGKVRIRINEIKGIYREDDPHLRYEVRGQRKRYILNLLHGDSIDYGLKKSRYSTISNAVIDINRICKSRLKVDFDLIDHSNSSSYFLDETYGSYIKDEISTVTVTDQ
jgi:hypothetical protein